MKIVKSLLTPLQPLTFTILTIGNFDGVHLGHWAVIDSLKAAAHSRSATSALLTFSNHPSTILKTSSPTPLLCTTEHKVILLEKQSIDLLILLPFTRQLSLESAEEFLQSIQKALHFDTLILGNDAAFGKDKTGNQKVVKSLSKSLGFNVIYLPDSTVNGERISSSVIRQSIQQGNLTKAAALLGRPFSIYSPVTSGTGRGSTIGFPTANIHVDGLCLPPLGVYAVTVKHAGNTYYGVANLGIAPTLRNDLKTIFEVHLFDHTSNLYGESVEVVFDLYIRQEKRFNHIDELKTQIAKDIKMARNIHNMK